MRYELDRDPFLPPPGDVLWRERGHWPASWIGAHGLEAPFVAAFRCCFRLPAAATIRLHVSADERYELFLDGARIGRGPSRGSPERWHFDSYELHLDAGEHLLAARVWALGRLAALAQMSVWPGFLCAAEAPYGDLLSTGRAAWEVRELPGYRFLDPRPALWRSHRTLLDGASYAWGWEQDRDQHSAWKPAATLAAAVGRRADWELPPAHLLAPNQLPPPAQAVVSPGQVRYVGTLGPDAPHARPIRSAESLPHDDWQALADQSRPLTLPAYTAWRVLFDLGNYYCAYPALVISGGAGATLRLHWAEALRTQPDPWNHHKGHRDEVEGKYFAGVGDEFLADGGARRVFEPLWWQAGRYLELVIRTAGTPLTINQFILHETRYPLAYEGDFTASDERLAGVIPLMVRGMQMCAHETYMDCPYYEELQYAGDTRLEILTTYAMTHDARLAREALLQFDVSRLPLGFTQSRYPSRTLQIIAPFSLWWVMMVYDYAFWQSDPATVVALMPGVRATLEAWNRVRRPDGLYGAPEGWNFVDWVPAWSANAGTPPGAAGQPSAPINWQIAYVQTHIAILEEAHGEHELAARLRRRAHELAGALEPFWNEARGLYADDLAQTAYSEHTQCLALLSGLLLPQRRQRVAAALTGDARLERTTIYFSHYLFETYRLLERVDLLLERMQLWFDLPHQGFCTPLESPEPSRSDCHAWSSHPLFHYQATILGIRPAEPGFRRVEITPQLASLSWARGRLPHPQGWIDVDVRVQDNRLHTAITLPNGIDGTLRWNGRDIALHGGWQEFVV